MRSTPHPRRLIRQFSRPATILLAVWLTACDRPATPQAPSAAAPADPLPATVAALNPGVTPNATWRVAVEGMDCKNCAAGLKSELQRARGVAGAAVSLSDKAALVLVDTNATSAEALQTVIREAGFQGTVRQP